MKLKKMQKGFTLIELMIVVAIIGILASFALPAYSTYTNKAKFAETIVALGAVKSAVDICYQTEGSLADCDTAAKLNVALADMSAGIYVTSVALTSSTAKVTGTSTLVDGAATPVAAYTAIMTPTPTTAGGTLTWAMAGTGCAKGWC